MKTPIAAVPLLLALLALPGIARAQQGPARMPTPDVGDVIGYDQYDAPSGVDYGYHNIWRCVQVSLDGNLLDDDCWGTAAEEDATREEVKALDRIVRAGALMLASLAAGIDYIRQVIHASEELFATVQNIVRGFDSKKPERTLYRLARASDRYENNLRRAEHVSLRHQLPTRNNERYAAIQTLTIRALALAANANEAAVTLSDQASGMQIRLDDDGRLNVHALMGASSIAATRRTDLPPLPDDAPSSASSFYAKTLASLPAGAASYAPDLAPTRLASLSRAGTDESGDDETVCMFADDMAEDPAVIYQRVIVMAQGAQTAATPSLANIGEERDMLDLIRLREIQFEREMLTRRLFMSMSVL